jgi:Fur family transcriptional regulator, ferric uptake regulator
MKAVDVLYSHNLKRTSCREGIIEVMMASENALSENEIRQKLAGNYDRTTFYRSFKTLEKHKIIHRIVIDNLMIKYAFAVQASQNKDHAHFFCNNCQTLLCMEIAPAKELQLPAGFKETEKEILIKGTCATCKNSPACN